MKKLIYLALIGVSSISCINQGDVFQNIETEKSFSELKVPNNFDWKITKDVTCLFSSEEETKVSVYTSPNEEAFAIFTVGKNIDPVTLNIPKSITKLYVSANGEKTEVAINGNTASCQLPANKLMTRSVKQDTSKDKESNVLGYPADSWGTLMFEDLWPSYGDYDFNDFVANYKIQLHLQNKNKVMAVHIGLYINAIGGSLPYDFYLQLNNVTGGQIESIDRGECENFGGDAKMMWVDPGESDKNPAIFKFDGIRSNIHKPEGSIFLNTEKGFEIEQSKLGRISYMIYFRNAIDLDNLNFDSFNFFLGKPIAEGSNELQEIHFSGQEPSIFGRNYYNEKLTNTNMDGSKKWYSSNTNIVWAIHIPTSLYHTTEKSSFMKAYPKFEKWITTGGAEATDWYIGHENRNPEYLMK